MDREVSLCNVGFQPGSPAMASMCSLERAPGGGGKHLTGGGEGEMAKRYEPSLSAESWWIPLPVLQAPQKWAEEFQEFK